MVVVGLIIIDVGGIRRRNSLNATVEKMVGFFISFTTYYFIGFAYWAAQYYIMVDGTLMNSIKDWWFGGALANEFAHKVDPAVFPGINNFQMFIFFLAFFAGIISFLLHFAASERMKPSAFYNTCFVATIVSSLLRARVKIKSQICVSRLPYDKARKRRTKALGAILISFS